MSWQILSLGETCEIVMGQAPSGDTYNNENEGFPLIAGAGDFKNGIINVNKFTTAPTKLSAVNDIILSIRASIGDKVWSDSIYCLGRGVAAIRPNPCFDKRFLWHSLTNLEKDLAVKGKGATFQQVNKEDISSLKIPLPPLPEQKRIAAILDKADELKRKREAAIAKLDQLAQSIFVEMFGDVATNNKGWKIERLGNVLDELTDYHANGSYEVLRNNVELKDEPDYALMLRTTDLENKNFTDGVKYITEHAYNFLKKSQVYGGEIIINKIGSAGNVYLAPYFNKPVSLGMNSFLLRINQQAHSKFIYDALSTNYISANIRSKVQGAVTKTITKDAVRSIEIPLPPLELQHQYVNVVNMLEMQKSKFEGYLSKLNQLFSSLQHQAFAGHL